MARFTNTPAEACWYTLKADRDLPAEEQSRFLLRPLTVAERMRVLDDFQWTVQGTSSDETTIRRRNFQQALELALSHIARIDNCPAGAPVPWPEGRAEREAYLARMDDLDVWELGNAIREGARMPSVAAAPEGKRGTPEEEAHDAKNS